MGAIPPTRPARLPDQVVHLAVAAGLAAVLLGACGDSGGPTPSDPEVTGDPERGEELFTTGMPEVHLGDSCSTCHSRDGSPNPWGPSLQGAYERAQAVEGMSAVAYLREAIVDTEARPSATWEGSYNMPENYGEVLTDDEIDDLIAYMYTLT